MCNVSVINGAAHISEKNSIGDSTTPGMLGISYSFSGNNKFLHFQAKLHI
jgi:hypothetical protein